MPGSANARICDRYTDPGYGSVFEPVEQGEPQVSKITYARDLFSTYGK